MRPLFPPVWDSTMVAALRACPRKMELQYVNHWKPKTESVHLVAGKAFAAGIEAARIAHYINGTPPEEASAYGIQALMRGYGNFQPPEHGSGAAKTLERMCGALEFYFSRYPLGADGATPIFHGEHRGIEFGFSVPLPIDHPTLKQPLIYVGRTDMTAHAYGGIMVYDEKTTTSLGESWGRQWDLRSQFTGYVWGHRHYGIKATGVVVRGISILKTKYDTQQVITYRPQWQLDRWEYQTLRDIRNAIRMWEEGYWDYNLDNACTDYGGCPLKDVCLSPAPDDWLPMRFERKVWDPIGREEIAVDTWEQLWGHNATA